MPKMQLYSDILVLRNIFIIIFIYVAIYYLSESLSFWRISSYHIVLQLNQLFYFLSQTF